MHSASTHVQPWLHAALQPCLPLLPSRPPCQSVYHVCWMRGLFPDASFSGHDLKQLDGAGGDGSACMHTLHVQLPARGRCMLTAHRRCSAAAAEMHIKTLNKNPADEEATMLQNWVEQGAPWPAASAARIRAHAAATLPAAPRWLAAPLAHAHPAPALAPALPARHPAHSGVMDAVQRGFLKALYFGIAEDAGGTRLLEVRRRGGLARRCQARVLAQAQAQRCRHVNACMHAHARAPLSLCAPSKHLAAPGCTCRHRPACAPCAACTPCPACSRCPVLAGLTGVHIHLPLRRGRRDV